MSWLSLVRASLTWDRTLLSVRVWNCLPVFLMIPRALCYLTQVGHLLYLGSLMANGLLYNSSKFSCRVLLVTKLVLYLLGVGRRLQLAVLRTGCTLIMTALILPTWLRWLYLLNWTGILTGARLLTPLDLPWLCSLWFPGLGYVLWFTCNNC